MNGLGPSPLAPWKKEPILLRVSSLNCSSNNWLPRENLGDISSEDSSAPKSQDDPPTNSNLIAHPLSNRIHLTSPTGDQRWVCSPLSYTPANAPLLLGALTADFCRTFFSLPLPNYQRREVLILQPLQPVSQIPSDSSRLKYGPVLFPTRLVWVTRIQSSLV